MSSHASKKIKTRQCVGCREEDSDSMLERFVLIEEEKVELLYDFSNRLPGRGAYLHLEKRCWEKGVPGGLYRSFKRNDFVVDRAALISEVKKGIKRRILERMRGGFKSTDGYVGERKVAEAMKDEKLKIVFIASDAGESTAKKYSLNCERKKICCKRSFDRSELGKLVGSEGLSLIGFGGSLGEYLLNDATKYDKLLFFET